MKYKNDKNILTILVVEIIFALLIILFFLPSTYADPLSENTHNGLFTKTIPSVAFPEGEIGLFKTTVYDGYPYVQQPYALLTDEEIISLHNSPNQTLDLIVYQNPPIFPNETVYGILHKELKYVSWLKEFTDPETGNNRLCQVADSGEFGITPYQSNLSPAENDYKGIIEWYLVEGKFYPRTWINGTMYEGQTWTEWWGPFTPDSEGSLFRERQYTVSKGQVPIGDKNVDGYIVSINGPGEFNQFINTTEIIYFVDGIGPIGHDFYDETSTTLPLKPQVNTPADAPTSLPPNTPVFSHQARCENLTIPNLIQ